MQKILKNGTKVLKKKQLNNKIFKIMKTIYQIVTKGVASNKISVRNTESYQDYRDDLEFIKNDDLFTVLTTNVYIDYGKTN